MVKDAEGVSTEGGMGLTVLEWGLLLVLAASSRFLWVGCWFCGGVVTVEVPCQQGEVPEESGGVEGVVAMCLIGGGSQLGGCSPC